MMKRILLVLVVAALFVPMPPASAGGGGCRDPRASSMSTTDVDLRDFCFSPTIVHARPGQRLTWTNRDTGVHHTVTAGIGTWGPDDLGPGRSLSHTFTEAGLYPFYCR